MENDDKSETRSFTFRIKENSYKELDSIATEEERSIAWLINKAIERYLQEKRTPAE